MSEVVLEHVSKSFGETQAAKNLSLRCRDNEFLVFLGPSGCGKTTILRMIAGLEPIEEGNIYIDGKIVNHLSPQKRNIAMAFEAYALYPSLNVYGNVAFPLKIKGISSKKIRDRVETFADLLNLSDILDRWPNKLTDGQKQRVSLARALIREPSVFLLDEPISHMDEEERDQLLTVLKRIHKNLQSTFIYVTHDQLDAISIADRIGVMNFGVLQQVGSPDEIFSYPANKFVASFVGEPPINTFECAIVERSGSVFLQTKSAQAQIKISKERGKAILGTGSDHLEIGLRPWDLNISELPTSECYLSGEFLDSQSFCDSSLVNVRVGEKVLNVLKEGEFNPNKGTKLWLAFDESKMHLFDSRSGCRI